MFLNHVRHGGKMKKQKHWHGYGKRFASHVKGPEIEWIDSYCDELSEANCRLGRECPHCGEFIYDLEALSCLYCGTVFEEEPQRAL
jgi:hypothetical protein